MGVPRNRKDSGPGGSNGSRKDSEESRENSRSDQGLPRGKVDWVWPSKLVEETSAGDDLGSLCSKKLVICNILGVYEVYAHRIKRASGK